MKQMHFSGISGISSLSTTTSDGPTNGDGGTKTYTRAATTATSAATTAAATARK